jgi:hypothetical protein
VFVHCYGRGIYGSYDIAQLLEREAPLLELLGAAPDDWHALRRLRREYHASIRQALVEVMRAAWELKSANADEPRRGSTATQRFELGAGQLQQKQTPDFEREAESRLRQAMFCDSMALDD